MIVEALDAMAEVEVVLADRLAASTGTSQHVHGDRQSAHISGILRELALEPSAYPALLRSLCHRTLRSSPS